LNFRQLCSIAWRYTVGLRAGYLSSFLSMLSMLGIVLAIALLILVLSVMNGFDREMRENILALVPQLTIKSWQAFGDWEQQAQSLRKHSQVVEVAPFVQFQAMLVHEGIMETALVNGFSSRSEYQPSALDRLIDSQTRERFADLEKGLLLGSALARNLGLEEGDRVTLIVPSGSGQPTAPRFEHLLLVGVLHSGTELDEAAAFVQLDLAASLAGVPGRVHGFRLSLLDIFQAPAVGWELVEQMPPGYYASDWTMTHGNLYAAIQLSRDMIGILLFSIIAIAAFNVVSSLVLVVIDKHSDIAILRALGATPANINGIFLLQGMLIAAVGTVLGSGLGALASYWISDIVQALERLLSIQFLTTDVYPISYLPSDLRLSDIVMVNAVTVLMCFFAALYPARRAAALPPAEALRHD